MVLQSVNKNEIKRKLIHLGALSVPLMYVFFDYIFSIIVMAMLCAIAAVIEITRLRIPEFNDRFTRLVGSMLKPTESNAVTAATFMAFSSLITILVFQKPVAILTLFFFIAGDAFASIAGKLFGRTIVFGKTLEGSLACFLICILIGMVIGGLPVWIWVAGALVITLSELMPMSLDDNIRIPLIGGACMEIFVWFHINILHLSIKL